MLIPRHPEEYEGKDMMLSDAYAGLYKYITTKKAHREKPGLVANEAIVCTGHDKIFQIEFST